MELKSLVQVKSPGLYDKLPATAMAGISFGPGYVNLCITDKSEKKALAFESIIVTDTSQTYPLQITGILDELVKIHPWLKNDALELIVSLDVPKYMLVPASLFSAEKKDVLFGRQHPALAYGEWTYQDSIAGMDAVMLYALPLSVENRIRSHFPKALLQHAHSLLIQGLLRTVREYQIAELAVVHVNTHSLDFAVFKSGRLTFINNYTYQTNDDLVYYTLLGMKEAGLSASGFPLRICGDVSLISGLEPQLQSFIPQLCPLEIPSIIAFGSAFDKTSYHKYFPLICIIS